MIRGAAFIQLSMKSGLAIQSFTNLVVLIYVAIEELIAVDSHEDENRSKVLVGIDHFLNKLFSIKELKLALKRCHDTATGSDNIHYQFLKHLPDSTLNCLLEYIITFGKVDISQIHGKKL